MTTPSDRDWTEDFPHENGNYHCQCTACELIFIGHKRRVQCKACHDRSWGEWNRMTPEQKDAAAREANIALTAWLKERRF